MTIMAIMTIPITYIKHDNDNNNDNENDNANDNENDKNNHRNDHNNDKNDHHNDHNIDINDKNKNNAIAKATNSTDTRRQFIVDHVWASF